MASWANLFGYQATWFAVAWSAGHGRAWIGMLACIAFIGVQWRCSHARRADARVVLAALACGLLVDGIAAAPGLLVVTDVTEFRLDGYRAYLSPAIDCFDGWPICWRVSVHADSDLMVGMLRDLVGIVGPTEDRPLTVHTDGGAVEAGQVAVTYLTRLLDEDRAELAKSEAALDALVGRAR